jgi:hypothetical protein
MSTGAIVVIVVIVLVIVGLVALMATRWQHRKLRNRFGPEYDHVLNQTDNNRKAAEQELAARQHRHDSYDLRPLSDDARQRFEAEWTQVQERFVDSPREAVADADNLITAILAERGYPTKGFDEQAADLSVEHPHVVDAYRRAHTVTSTTDETDDLRRALLDYRSVFESVIGRERTHA